MTTSARKRRLLAATGTIGVVVAALVLAPPCLFTFALDPTELRPRSTAIMNPLRNRGPERVAEQYLSALAAGRAADLQSTFGANRDVMVDGERKYPPVSWRIADRDDREGTTILRYWVRRANGYPGEEEASLEVVSKGSWRVRSYNAVY